MPGNDKLLSVCCLGYRHAPYIRDCITTIWQDPWPHVEIIAMDDGSNDGSLEILKELQKESPCPFTVLEQENTGNIAANFNRLFGASRGAYTLFTSLDDMQIPGSLEERMERLLADENIAFAAHTKAFAKEKGKKLVPDEAITCTPAMGVEDLLLRERMYFHSFYIQECVFRRDVLEAVGAFDEDMLGDDIVLRTKVLFHMLDNPVLRFSLIDAPGLVYRRHTGNVSKNVMRQLRLAFQYHDHFWKWEPYPDMLKQWLLTGLAELPYEEIINVFSLTPQASLFLKDPDIQNGLRLNAAKSCIQENNGVTKRMIHA